MKRFVMACLLLVAGCETQVIVLVLPTLNGIWDIELVGTGAAAAIRVDDNKITGYDQGDGNFQDVSGDSPINQSSGVVSFSFVAMHTFTDFNNGNPAEFAITGEGTIQTDGAIVGTITFKSLDGSNEGSADIVMRAR